MVVDHIYIEYGFDKEAIRAAMIKHNVSDDKSFEMIIDKLEKYHDNSFLNI